MRGFADHLPPLSMRPLSFIRPRSGWPSLKSSSVSLRMPSDWVYAVACLAPSSIPAEAVGLLKGYPSSLRNLIGIDTARGL
jgi:hypothetical protein